MYPLTRLFCDSASLRPFCFLMCIFPLYSYRVNSISTFVIESSELVRFHMTTSVFNIVLTLPLSFFRYEPYTNPLSNNLDLGIEGILL